MKTQHFRICVFLLIGAISISISGCAKKNFEWQAEAHTKELDRKKGYKQKKHRANKHRYGQHHSKHHKRF